MSRSRPRISVPRFSTPTAIRPARSVRPPVAAEARTLRRPRRSQCANAINYLKTRVKPQLVPRNADVNLLFGKIDYQLNERNRFSAEMNYLDFRSPNGIQTQGALTTGAGIGNNANTNVFDRTIKSGLLPLCSRTPLTNCASGCSRIASTIPPAPSLEPVTGLASYSISTGSLSNIGYATSYPRLHPSELRFQLSDTYSMDGREERAEVRHRLGAYRRLRLLSVQPVRNLQHIPTLTPWLLISATR